VISWLPTFANTRDASSGVMPDGGCALADVLGAVPLPDLLSQPSASNTKRTA
jgi:hypothetical protein